MAKSPGILIKNGQIWESPMYHVLMIVYVGASGLRRWLKKLFPIEGEWLLLTKPYETRRGHRGQTATMAAHKKDGSYLYTKAELQEKFKTWRLCTTTHMEFTEFQPEDWNEKMA